jgi:hypothetical protein
MGKAEANELTVQPWGQMARPWPHRRQLVASCTDQKPLSFTMGVEFVILTGEEKAEEEVNSPGV